MPQRLHNNLLLSLFWNRIQNENVDEKPTWSSVTCDLVEYYVTFLPAFKTLQYLLNNDIWTSLKLPAAVLRFSHCSLVPNQTDWTVVERMVWIIRCFLFNFKCHLCCGWWVLHLQGTYCHWTRLISSSITILCWPPVSHKWREPCYFGLDWRLYCH